MTICWGKRRGAPPTIDNKNIQGKCRPQKSVLCIPRKEAITQKPLGAPSDDVYILESRKGASESVCSDSFEPKFREPVKHRTRAGFRARTQTCPQHVRPSSMRCFAYQRAGFVFSDCKGHSLWVWCDVVSEGGVSLRVKRRTVRAHKEEVNIQPTRHLKEKRQREFHSH